MAIRIYALLACLCASVRLSGSAPQSCADMHQCPPEWAGLMEQYKHVLQPRTLKKICSLAIKQKMITACNNPGHRCNSTAGNDANLPTFYCCPTSCLASINTCYKGAQTDALCIPSNVARWQNAFMNIVIAELG